MEAIHNCVYIVSVVNSVFSPIPTLACVCVAMVSKSLPQRVMCRQVFIPTN